MLSIIDIILLVIVAALLGLAIYGAGKRTKNGCCNTAGGCGMNCAACSKSGKKECKCNE